MKKRTLLIVVIILTIVGDRIWVWQHPAQVESAAPAKVTEAPKPAAVATPQPKPLAAPQTIAAPKAPPVVATQPTTQTVAKATSAKNDPQASLDNMVDEVLNLFQAGDIATVWEKYTWSESMNKLAPEEKAQRIEQMRRMATQPGMDKVVEMQSKMIQTIRGQAPAMNAAGDEATFQATVPQGAFMMSGSTNTADTASADPSKMPVTFIKVDGKWYVKGS